ncbi:hypothetical protein TNCV_2287671 [Trichonephila clavipes]|nr:hypothetical protein TNCV_2287671 [Trichonephila clavipes]
MVAARSPAESSSRPGLRFSRVSSVNVNSNSVAQQPMRARIYRAHPSILDQWVRRVHKQMSRSDGQSEARPPVFESPSKLVTH